MKNRLVCLHFLLFSIIAISNCNAEKRLLRLYAADTLTVENPLNKASPADSVEYSIQIIGQSNIVKINDKLMKSSRDTIINKNKIIVSGAGNTVDIKHYNDKSEVNIRQQGNKNKIIIRQELK